MKSYIVKLIQDYLDILKLNEDMNTDIVDSSVIDVQDTSIASDEGTDDTIDDNIYDKDSKNHLDNNQSELDKIHRGEKFSKEELLQTNTPIIYAFITKYAPNAIKIGYTVQGAEQRVQQWRKYYKDAKLIGWWTAIQLDNAMHKVFFMDFNVHQRTRQYGYSNLKDESNKIDLDEFKRLAKEDGIEDIHVSSEFFMKYKNMKIKDPSSELNEKVITDIIKEIKDDISKGKNVGTLYDLETHQEQTHHEYGACDTYENTPLQQDAINKAIQAMNDGKNDLLLSAVMRFGKTHCCYEIIKESKDIKYVLVTSAKADVKAAWKDDINHKDFLDDFVFVEFDQKGGSLIISKKGQSGKYSEDKKQNPNMIKQYIDEGKTVIVFATLQDLAGNKGFDVNTIKEKHKFLYNDEYPFDMIIIDETHYGSHSDVYGMAIGLANNEYKKISKDYKEAKNEAEELKRFNNAVREIKHKYTLQCSGTPYYILANGEFSEIYKNKKIISNVGFSDMIDARNKWVDEHPNEDESKSPYFGIPNLVKFGMNLTKECRNALKNNTDISTSLSYLFKNENNKFINEDAIVELMESIFGSNNHEMPSFLDQERIKNGEIFKHIIMVLPHIDDCHILRKLLIEKNIIDENDRKIIVATERRTAKTKGAQKLDSEAKDSTTLNQALWKLENENKKSLTITVNRFLTGVSVPLWDAMFYMKDTASPQEYDQAIFRLCTRNVGNAKYTDENGVQHEQKICRKSNVYLIDFKIDRMYNMMVKSAVAQASYNANDKVSTINQVKDIINRNIHDMPTYADSVYDSKGKYIMNGGMHEITADDLLKQYVQYNRERSIEDSINLKDFNSFLNNTDNLQYLNRWDEGLLNQTKLTQKEGEDELDFDNAIQKKLNKSSKSDKGQKGSKKENQVIETMKKKFTTMLKAVLYSCICMDKVPEDIENYIKLVRSDYDCEQIAKDFKIDIDELHDIISHMYNNEKMQINMLIYQLKSLLDDQSISPMQRVQNAVSKLGKLDKSEVITPESLTSKMVKKLSKEDIQNADSILLVNEKICEFLIQLYKDYGIDICKKCRIVASSQLTINFIKKILKTLGLNQSIILDIGDLDGNGSYDVKDFLQMKNEDILKMNNEKKFDIILSNAPYDNGLHEKFEAKYFDICDGQICWVSPLSFLLGKKQNKRITEQINRYIANIEQINGNEYFDANIGGNMGITYINMNNDTHHNRRYILFDGKKYDKCEKISTYSNDPLLMKFKSIVENIINKNGNIDEHILAAENAKNVQYKKQKYNNYVTKMDLFSGSGSESNVGRSFYTLFSNNSILKNRVNLYTTLLDNQKDKFKLYIPFKNYITSYNFYNYMQTYFCRICLYFSKTNLHLDRGELKYIPWFDFTNNLFNNSIEDIDINLFKKYNISQDIVNHILEILPNYYNLDLSKYKNIKVEN